MQYESDIVLGGKYRDRQTGFEGVAVVISFHQHSCERVVVEGKAEGGDIKAFEFDAVRLASLDDKTPAYEKPTTGAYSGRAVSTGRRRS